MDADALQFHAVLSQHATRAEAALDGLLPAGDTTPRRRHAPCGARAAASGCARSWRWRAAAMFRVPPGQALADRGGGGVHPRLQPGARRPALHGRRRPAPRPADGAREVGRGDGGAGRRRAAGARLRGAGGAAGRDRAAPAGAAAAAAGAGGRRARHGGRAGVRPRRREGAGGARSRGGQRPAGAEDRGALRLGGGVRRDPRAAGRRSRCAAMRRPSGSPTRSATTSSTSRAMRRRRASGCARTRRAARRPSCR